MADAVRRMGDEIVGQRLGRFGREEAGVGVFQTLHLGAHGGQNVRVAMAEARHGGAAGGVDVGLAGGVGDGEAGGADGDRRGSQAAVNDVACPAVAHETALTVSSQ